MNHLLLHLLAASAAPEIHGRRVRGIRLLPPILTVAFQGETDVRYGVVVLSTPGPFFYLDTEEPLAGTGAEVFKRIEGFLIGEVSVLPGERVIRFELAGHREPATLAVYLFGSAAKVRVEGPEAIIESLDPAECGGPLPPPSPSRGKSLVSIDAERFSRFLEPGDGFARGIPGLTPELLDCFTAPDGAVRVERLIAFRDALLLRREAFVLGTRKRPGAVCPLPLGFDTELVGSPLAATYGPFRDAEEACRRVGASITGGLRTEIIERFAAPLVKHLAGRKRLLSALETEKKDAEGFYSLRNEANILAAYQSRIGAGASTVTLPNLYGDGEIAIELEPAVSISEQIRKRFRRASKLERSRVAVEKRIRAVVEEIESLEKDIDAARQAASLENAVRPIERLRRRFGLEPAPRREERVARRSKELRRIELDAQWFVLVGRSDRENDEITFRIASPDDIWFHAQHIPGSHVVLKSHGAPGNPPDPILETAAEIAAHYSKARRSSVVPVIYTRRKYVRKFRGAKPGQVVCEREKTILAKPRLPEAAKK